MADLIDRQELISWLSKDPLFPQVEAFGLTSVIESRPSVDAVPVVRCKDCIWYESVYLKRDGTTDKRYKPNVCVRGRYAKPRKADWYCANGERRQDG